MSHQVELIGTLSGSFWPLYLGRAFRAKPQSTIHSRAKVHAFSKRQHVVSLRPRNWGFVFAERISHLFKRQAQLANVYELSYEPQIFGRQPVV